MLGAISRSLVSRLLLLFGAPLCLVLAALAPAQAALTPVATSPMTFWQTNGRVQAILATPGALYIGGTFTQLIGPSGQTVSVQNIAALSPTTGAPLSGFSAAVNKQVWDFALCGTTLYAVGDFGYAGSVRRQKAAAFNASTGALLSWNPKANGRIYSAVCTSSSVYLGGNFTALHGTSRPYLAAVDPTSGAIQSGWNPTPNNTIKAIAPSPDGTQLVVGGLFTNISGTSKQHIASVSPSTGGLQSWPATTTDPLDDVIVVGSQVFAAGEHNMTEAFSLSTGARQWVSTGNGNVQTLTELNGVLYVGGHFSIWNNLTAKHIVALDPATGRTVTWSINENSALGTWALANQNGMLYVGGDFTKINRELVQHLAVFE